MTHTVNDRAEALRDFLERKFQEHTDQLTELTMHSRQLDRGGYDPDSLRRLMEAARGASRTPPRRCGGCPKAATAAARAAVAIYRWPAWKSCPGPGTASRASNAADGAEGTTPRVRFPAGAAAPAWFAGPG